MLAPADRIKFASQNVVQSLPPLIAPVKGWNTRDALDAMDPADAVILQNWFPDAGGAIVRNGFAPYAYGMGTDPVNTLAEFYSGGTRKFIAACGGSFYDVSAGGAVGAALASGFSTQPWQTVAFLSKLFFFNGSDAAQIYGGSTFSNASFSGVTTSTLVGGIAYQNRLLMWATASTGFWYAALNSISGSVSFFDLSPFTPHGGNLTAAATFSHDGGNGVLDFVVFMMSSGDCLLYYGNDPGDINNWQLVGIYRISPPVSPRAVCNYGAEAFVTTFDDHVPLQQQLAALRDGRLPPRSKVSSAVQAAVQANLNGFGWQALYYPAGRRLIFNIPNTDGTFSQHVQNTEITYTDSTTGVTASPWCEFINMNAYTWGLFDNGLYFGAADGQIFQADTGTLDDTSAIQANAQQSWNTFGDPQRKRFTAARPVMQITGAATYALGLGFDYGPISITMDVTTSATGTPWNVSPWNTSPWSDEGEISTLWQASGGEGVAVSVALSMASTLGATWLRTDFKAERGMLL